MASSAKKIMLVSSDGEVFEVEEAVALQSQTIKHMFEDDCAKDQIPIHNVTGKILSMIIRYCKKHAHAPPPKPTAPRRFAAPRRPAAPTEEEGKSAAAAAAPTGKDKSAASAAAPAEEDEEDKAAAELKSWDAEFVKVGQGTIFDLLLAANYLNIKSLLDLTRQTVVEMIEGKTPEELRKLFNIKNDFTPEEEEKCRMENFWAFEKKNNKSEE